MRQTLHELLQQYRAEVERLPPYSTIANGKYRTGYNELDAFLLYMMLRQLKPARYLEVGSGLSVYYSSRAAAQNALGGRPMEMTCIEPHPSPSLSGSPGLRVVAKEVQDVGLDIFRSLSAGDILFIDSSHTLRIDSDVAYLLLEVAPVLATGVNIHIADVPFPYNCPFPAERWIFERTWPAYWNEAMVLQALLCNNSRIEITMSLPLLRFHDERKLSRMMPRYKSIEEEPKTFSSIWLRINNAQDVAAASTGIRNQDSTLPALSSTEHRSEHDRQAPPSRLIE
jgi:hypothetical protein